MYIYIYIHIHVRIHDKYTYIYIIIHSHTFTYIHEHMRLSHGGRGAPSSLAPRAAAPGAVRPPPGGICILYYTILLYYIILCYIIGMCMYNNKYIDKCILSCPARRRCPPLARRARASSRRCWTPSTRREAASPHRRLPCRASA